MDTTVLISVTLDTKPEEALFVRGILEEHGLQVLIADCGSLGAVPPLADFTRQEVARRAGLDLDRLVASGDKGRIQAGMSAGLNALVHQLHQAGSIQGILALGGGQGTALGTAAMQLLPLGFPKVMVTTLAAGNLRPFLQTKDIAVFPSVADMLGMNRVLELTLSNAANALAAMVFHRPAASRDESTLLGATAFGVTTRGLMMLRSLLEGPGLEMVFFHANGVGGCAMEDLAKQGLFAGLLDWTTHEITDLVGHGIFAAQPDHLDFLAEQSIPCLVSTGAIDYICKGPADEMDASWQERNIIVHNRNITLVRATAGEMVQSARFLAGKLNRAKGPVKVMIPLKGFSEPNAEGKQFYDPAADKEFREALGGDLDPGIEVIDLPHHINDDEFVARAAKEIRAMLPG